MKINPIKESEFKEAERQAKDDLNKIKDGDTTNKQSHDITFYSVVSCEFGCLEINKGDLTSDELKQIKDYYELDNGDYLTNETIKQWLYEKIDEQKNLTDTITIFTKDELTDFKNKIVEVLK
jgi:hypothetical protein